jgi:hypothetical protein
MGQGPEWVAARTAVLAPFSIAAAVPADAVDAAEPLPLARVTSVFAALGVSPQVRVLRHAARCSCVWAAALGGRSAVRVLRPTGILILLLLDVLSQEYEQEGGCKGWLRAMRGEGVRSLTADEFWLEVCKRAGDPDFDWPAGARRYPTPH